LTRRKLSVSLCVFSVRRTSAKIHHDTVSEFFTLYEKVIL
jgi:hypothetical protein